MPRGPGHAAFGELRWWEVPRVKELLAALNKGCFRQCATRVAPGQAMRVPQGQTIPADRISVHRSQPSTLFVGVIASVAPQGLEGRPLVVHRSEEGTRVHPVAREAVVVDWKYTRVRACPLCKAPLE